MKVLITVEQHLIAAGVKNLREFGYPDCNAENVLTDEIYSAFFKNMLAENRGKYAPADKAISVLLNKIEQARPARKDDDRK